MKRHALAAALTVALVGSGVVFAAPATAAAPTVKSFSPTAGKLKSTVTITGKGFNAGSTVRFNGVPAATTRLSSTRLRAVVPLTAKSGAISVSSSKGTGRSKAAFRVVSGAVLSVIAGRPTTKTALYVSGFSGYEAIDVSFDTATVKVLASSSSGAAQYTLTVPASAAPGAHSITAVGRHSGLSAQGTFTVRTDVTQAGFDAVHSGFNPYENQLSPANVAQVQRVWHTSIPASMSSTPAVVAGVVYATFGDGSVRAFSASTGAQKWKLAAGGGTMFSSPTVSGGVVYFGSSDKKFYAVTASTGKARWSRATGDVVYSGAVVVGTTVYFGSYDKKVYALNTANGGLRWAHTFGAAIYGVPSYHEGRLFVGDFAGNVAALNPSTGAQLWTVPVGNLVLAPLALADGLVFAASEGHLFAIDESNGTVEWSKESKADAIGTHGGLVFVPSLTGVLTAYYAASGAVAWTVTLSTDALRSTVAIANGIVFVGGVYTYAVRESDGALLRQFTDGTAYGGATISDGTITLGNNRANLLVRYALPATYSAASARAAGSAKVRRATART